ncbi:MAG: hypothetical protein V2A56_03185 [bacterium]
MKLSQEEKDSLLFQIPAWRSGDLSPSDAHKITLLMKEDALFALEAKREEVLVRAIGGMKASPMPHGLLISSIRAAVGNAGTASWLSMDTLLIAIGVGVGCAGAAQFLSGKINFIPLIGQWLGSLAGVAVDQSLGSILGALALGSGALIVGGIAWAVKLLRS